MIPFQCSPMSILRALLLEPQCYGDQHLQHQVKEHERQRVKTNYGAVNRIVQITEVSPY